MLEFSLNLNYSLVEPLNTQELCDVTNGQVGYCPLNRESSCAPPVLRCPTRKSTTARTEHVCKESRQHIANPRTTTGTLVHISRQNEIAYPGTYKFLFDSNLFLYFITTAEQYNT